MTIWVVVVCWCFFFLLVCFPLIYHLLWLLSPSIVSLNHLILVKLFRTPRSPSLQHLLAVVSSALCDLEMPASNSHRMQINNTHESVCE